MRSQKHGKAFDIYVWGIAGITCWFTLLDCFKPQIVTRIKLYLFIIFLLLLLCCNLKLNFLKMLWLGLRTLLCQMLINLIRFLVFGISDCLYETSSGVNQIFTFLCGIIWIVKHPKNTSNTFANTGRQPSKLMTAVTCR